MFTTLLGFALLSQTPVFACPMQDAAAYQEAAVRVRSAQGTQVAFNVDGMSCGSCSSKLTQALSEIDGVVAAAVDYQTGQALIAFDSSKTNAKALLAAIEKNGFTAKKVS
jgi:copper chaperone CopZ